MDRDDDDEDDDDDNDCNEYNEYNVQLINLLLQLRHEVDKLLDLLTGPIPCLHCIDTKAISHVCIISVYLSSVM